MSYTLPSWADAPSTATPVDAANLGELNSAINDLDSRVSAVTFVPSWAGRRVSSYVPDGAFYNYRSDNTARFKARLAAARAGQGYARISLIGASTISGYGVTPGVDDPVVSMRKVFAQSGYLVGSRVRVCNAETLDSRLTNAGWTLVNTADQPIAYATSPGATFTYVSDTPGTCVEVCYLDSSSAMTVTVDGGSPSAVAVGGTNTVQTKRITGLANTTHTVVVTSGTGTNYLISLGVMAATGVVLENCGVSGSDTFPWLPTDWFKGCNTVANVSTTAVNPDAAFVELGGNDFLNLSATPAQVSANNITIVNSLKAAGLDVMLIATHRPNNSTTWFPYLSALYDAADVCDVPLWDMSAGWGDQARLMALGVLYTDNLHLNTVGYAMKADALAAACLPTR